MFATFTFLAWLLPSALQHGCYLQLFIMVAEWGNHAEELKVANMMKS